MEAGRIDNKLKDKNMEEVTLERVQAIVDEQHNNSLIKLSLCANKLLLCKAKEIDTLKPPDMVWLQDTHGQTTFEVRNIISCEDLHYNNKLWNRLTIRVKITGKIGDHMYGTIIDNTSENDIQFTAILEIWIQKKLNRILKERHVFIYDEGEYCIDQYLKLIQSVSRPFSPDFYLGEVSKDTENKIEANSSSFERELEYILSSIENSINETQLIQQHLSTDNCMQEIARNLFVLNENPFLKRYNTCCDQAFEVMYNFWERLAYRLYSFIKPKNLKQSHLSFSKCIDDLKKSKEFPKLIDEEHPASAEFRKLIHLRDQYHKLVIAPKRHSFPHYKSENAEKTGYSYTQLIKDCDAIVNVSHDEAKKQLEALLLKNFKHHETAKELFQCCITASDIIKKLIIEYEKPVQM
jgi:hypothetical protein